MAKLNGKITQESQEAPVIVLFGDTAISFTTEYVQEGQYKAVGNHPIFNSDAPPKWFIADSQGSRYAISQVNTTDVIIQSYDKDGNPHDGILTGVEFKIET